MKIPLAAPVYLIPSVSACEVFEVTVNIDNGTMTCVLAPGITTTIACPADALASIQSTVVSQIKTLGIAAKKIIP